jgi:3-oxoacyl-[acyl-carrier protein] reductase
MQTVVISGTSRGIGKELVLIFAKAGFQVYALSRNIKAVYAYADGHPNIKALEVDINEWESAVVEIKKEVKSIDILIHNAAAFINKPFAEMLYQDMQSVYHTNVMVPYFLTQSLLELLKAGSQILAISSVGGIGGSMKFPGLSVYSSSKGALNIMVECLAEELREREIFVNALALGSSATEMFKTAFPDFEAASQPEDMANYIYNFALNAVPLVNGKTFPISSQNP